MSVGLQYFFTVTFVFLCFESLQTYSILTNAVSVGGFIPMNPMALIGWGITGAKGMLFHNNILLVSGLPMIIAVGEGAARYASYPTFFT